MRHSEAAVAMASAVTDATVSATAPHGRWGSGDSGGACARGAALPCFVLVMLLASPAAAGRWGGHGFRGGWHHGFHHGFSTTIFFDPFFFAAYPPYYAPYPYPV